MVDDPNDEDFVPHRTRRTTRLSLRNQAAQRAARSTVTKMTCANCRTPLQKGQTAYQRKGLPQLFCSSSCLTTFSKRPLSKKCCTFCKKWVPQNQPTLPLAVAKCPFPNLPLLWQATTLQVHFALFYFPTTFIALGSPCHLLPTLTGIVQGVASRP